MKKTDYNHFCDYQYHLTQSDHEVYLFKMALFRLALLVLHLCSALHYTYHHLSSYNTQVANYMKQNLHVAGQHYFYKLLNITKKPNL